MILACSWLRNEHILFIILSTIWTIIEIILNVGSEFHGHYISWGKMLSHHVSALFFASWIIVSDHNKRCRAESAQILGQQHSLGTALYAFLS